LFSEPADKLVRRFSSILPATLKSLSLAADVAGMREKYNAKNMINATNGNFFSRLLFAFPSLFPVHHSHFRSHSNEFSLPMGPMGPMGIPVSCTPLVDDHKPMTAPGPDLTGGEAWGPVYLGRTGRLQQLYD